jgi:hypothetical protein
MPDTGTTKNKTGSTKLPVPDALKQLGVDPKAGLSAAEAKQRLAQHGANVLGEKKQSQLAVFLGPQASPEANEPAPEPAVAAPS